MIVEEEILKGRLSTKNLLTQWEFQEENRRLSLSLGAYYFLALLLKPSSGWPHFRLVLRGQAVGSRAIIGQAIGGQVIVDWGIVGRDHWISSHCRCNVNKRQGCFGGRKNDRLIGIKPPNPVGTEKENQDRKDLVVVQSSRINLCGQWCVELLHLQSTLRPGLYLGNLTRLRPVKPNLSATTLLPHGEFS